MFLSIWWHKRTWNDIFMIWIFIVILYWVSCEVNVLFFGNIIISTELANHLNSNYFCSINKILASHSFVSILFQKHFICTCGISEMSLIIKLIFDVQSILLLTLTRKWHKTAACPKRFILNCCVYLISLYHNCVVIKTPSLPSCFLHVPYLIR